MRRALATVAAVLVALAAPAAGAAPAPVAPGPRADVLRLPFPQDDGSLTPYTFELGYSLMTMVYDTLLWRDAEGVPRPWLARSVTPNADGRQLTIRLEPGARWHDGQPVTAEDVAFTFDYMARRPHPRFTPPLRDVERVDVIDPATLVVSLAGPRPGFDDQPLADMPILPAHLWRALPPDRAAPDGLPVGSGPYRLTRHEPGQGWRFEANADYFRGPPAVAAIEVGVIRDLEGTLRAFEQRRVDAVAASLPRREAQRVRGLGNRLAEGDSYLGTMLLLNTRQAPFDRPEARRAVAGALDAVQLARAVGNAEPALSGLLHPASAWAVDTLARPPADAAALPPTLRVLAPDNDPVKLAAARAVSRSLVRAGSRAEVVVVSRDELERAVGEDGSPPSFEAAVWSVPALASYDPSLLASLFGAGGLQARTNLSGYQSPRFDEAAARVVATADPAARRAAVADALGVLAADAPVVPLLFADGAFAYRPAAYDGWVYVKGTGIIDKRSFVEPAAPAAPPAGGAAGAPSGGGGGGGFPFGWVAAGVLAVAAAVALTQLRDRRQP